MTHYHLGLIGYPLEHSFSPRLYQAAFKFRDLHGRYDLFSIAPDQDGETRMQALMIHLRRGELQGINVTVPHKILIIPHLDRLSLTAAAIGAVNAVLVRKSQLVGENFDCAAFMADLTFHLDEAGQNTLVHQPRRSALVLGAGGAARAVVYGLLKAGWQVTVAARRLEQAQGLVSAFRQYQGLTTCRLGDLATRGLDWVDLIVNATPLGTHPDSTASPWPADVPFPSPYMVYDLVYNPGETALMARARRSGLLAVNGLGMLARQAAMSFEAWTGQSIDWQYLYHSLIHEVIA